MQSTQQSRRTARSIKTLRSMLITHGQTGQGPHLTAITTLYLNLLEQAAHTTVWQLFYKAASLPLRVTVSVSQCKAQPELQTESCGITRVIKVGGKKQAVSGCGHKVVEVTKLVTLEPLDEHRLQHGQTVNGQLVSGWWAKQLATALQGVA